MTFDKDHWESYEAPETGHSPSRTTRRERLPAADRARADHEWERFATAVRSVTTGWAPSWPLGFHGIPMGVRTPARSAVTAHGTRPEAESPAPGRSWTELQVPGAWPRCWSSASASRTGPPSVSPSTSRTTRRRPPTRRPPVTLLESVTRATGLVAAGRGAAGGGAPDRRGDRPPGGGIRGDRGAGQALERQYDAFVDAADREGLLADEAANMPTAERTRGAVRAVPGRAAGAAPTRPMRDTGHRAHPAGHIVASMLFPTSLVGSYPQPDWLIDRERLRHRFPPRVRAASCGRSSRRTWPRRRTTRRLLAIRAQEQAGLDIVTDGEMRRESYSNRFATALDGVDIDNPGTALDRSGHPNPVPRVTGPIRRRHPVEVEDLAFLRANTEPDRQDHRARPVHHGAAGAERLLRQHRGSRVLGYAEAVNEEVRDLFAAGADIVQLDEPYLQARPETARALRGEGASTGRWRASTGTTAVHLCFGYAAIIHDRPSGYSFLPELAAAGLRPGVDRDGPVRPGLLGARRRWTDKTIILGVLNLGDDDGGGRADRWRPGCAGRCRTCPPSAIVLAPDCGMKYLPATRHSASWPP